MEVALVIQGVGIGGEISHILRSLWGLLLPPRGILLRSATHPLLKRGCSISTVYYAQQVRAMSRGKQTNSLTAVFRVGLLRRHTGSSESSVRRQGRCARGNARGRLAWRGGSVDGSGSRWVGSPGWESRAVLAAELVCHHSG